MCNFTTLEKRGNQLIEIHAFPSLLLLLVLLFLPRVCPFFPQQKSKKAKQASERGYFSLTCSLCTLSSFSRSLFLSFLPPPLSSKRTKPAMADDWQEVQHGKKKGGRRQQQQQPQQQHDGGFRSNSGGGFRSNSGGGFRSNSGGGFRSNSGGGFQQQNRGGGRPGPGNRGGGFGQQPPYGGPVGYPGPRNAGPPFQPPYPDQAPMPIEPPFTVYVGGLHEDFVESDMEYIFAKGTGFEVRI